MIARNRIMIMIRNDIIASHMIYIWHYVMQLSKKCFSTIYHAKYMMSQNKHNVYLFLVNSEKRFEAIVEEKKYVKTHIEMYKLTAKQADSPGFIS
mgnify:FL=1